MLLTQNISVDKWNKIEDPNVNNQNYSHLLFEKEIKNWTGKNTASYPSAGM